MVPCGFVGGSPALPVGLQMIGAAFDEVDYINTSEKLESLIDCSYLFVYFDFCVAGEVV